MKPLLWQENSISYCPKEQRPCIGWVDQYFQDCLCNIKDELSFGFGLLSLVFWAVAEIPQIITNFKTKSSHGVSLFFLLAWVVGDMFNLMGCILEPATLPTQFYTALLYTATTLLLVLQSLYYDYVYEWWKSEKHDSKQENDEDDVKKPLRPSDETDLGIPIPRGVAIRTQQRKDYYYTSARSLAGSATPPIRSYLWPVKSGPSAVGINDDSSSEDETTTEATPPPSASISQPKPIPRSAGYAAFLLTSLNMPGKTQAMMQAYIVLSGRKLLQHGGGIGENVVGQCMGWMMAVIYMSGRIPQIWLNIKRGSVEGLNPLMFIFALVANATYVASILVRTTEWSRIKANMPWLLDAVACVGLDFFIILQYIYYVHFHKRLQISSRRLLC